MSNLPDSNLVSTALTPSQNLLGQDPAQMTGGLQAVESLPLDLRNSLATVSAAAGPSQITNSHNTTKKQSLSINYVFNLVGEAGPSSKYVISDAEPGPSAQRKPLPRRFQTVINLLTAENADSGPLLETQPSDIENDDEVPEHCLSPLSIENVEGDAPDQDSERVNSATLPPLVDTSEAERSAKKRPGRPSRNSASTSLSPLSAGASIPNHRRISSCSPSLPSVAEDNALQECSIEAPVTDIGQVHPATHDRGAPIPRTNPSSPSTYKTIPSSNLAKSIEPTDLDAVFNPIDAIGINSQGYLAELWKDELPLPENTPSHIRVFMSAVLSKGSFIPIPLWDPSPNLSSLSPESRRRHLSLGDVGIFTSNGRFEVLFNVFMTKRDNVQIMKYDPPDSFVAFKRELIPDEHEITLDTEIRYGCPSEDFVRCREEEVGDCVFCFKSIQQPLSQG
ncbi:hypothetical protein GALMADRAFT_927190 [Galerina marginata CBS 339.88]|uniref:Uncharacterized protein n=1 Tax=Galerina marginata (strain CBS 339.88) TaxID=685588 RepID=A0A067SED2_GALM3|nr:hypothetical protein GALMADRAFT_927190 [Galerina marginata CBS 339.88]